MINRHYAIVKPKFEDKAKKRISIASLITFVLILIIPVNLDLFSNFMDYVLIYVAFITLFWILFLTRYLDSFEIIDSLIISPSVIKTCKAEFKLDDIKFISLYPANVSAMLIFPTIYYYLCEIILSNLDTLKFYVTSDIYRNVKFQRDLIWNENDSIDKTFKKLKIRYKIKKSRV